MNSNSKLMKREIADALRGEVRRAAHRAVEELSTLEILASIGLSATDELFPDLEARELRSVARHLRALAAMGARSFAELENAAGRLDALAGLRDTLSSG